MFEIFKNNKVEDLNYIIILVIKIDKKLNSSHQRGMMNNKKDGMNLMNNMNNMN